MSFLERKQPPTAGEKVCVFGNSIPLLLMPDRKDASERTYGEWLEAGGFRVVNASKQAVMLADVFRYLEDEVIRHFPDYIVVNFGIVEAACRTKPRRLTVFFSGNAWNNEIVDVPHCSYLARGVRRVLRLAYKPVDASLAALGVRWRYMSPSRFADALDVLLKKLRSQTPARAIFVLGMLPVGPELEKAAPGTARSVERYNEIMKKACAAVDRARWVDMRELFARDLESATIDSIHYTAYGHRKVHDALAALIAEGA